MKVKRLLSDFTHVSDDHAKDGSWLGQDSQMYPFANLTFDQMVETYLPRAKEIFQTGTKVQAILSYFAVNIHRYLFN